MQPSRSFQKTLIIVNALFSGGFIMVSLFAKWANNLDVGGLAISLITLCISFMFLLLEWLDQKFLPTKERDKADKEAQEWKNYLKVIKKELLSNKDSS